MCVTVLQSFNCSEFTAVATCIDVIATLVPLGTIVHEHMCSLAYR